MFRYLALGLAILTCHSAGAATLQFNLNGEVSGATNVEVDGVFYDVEFFDGTCVEVFSGCNTSSNFDFNTQGAAILAAQALLDQVFIGGLDDDPSTVVGLDPSPFSYDQWFTLVPFFGDVTSGLSANAINRSLSYQGGIDTVLVQNFAPSYDTSNSTNGQLLNFARFTPSIAAVPVPATLPLLLTAMGAIGFAVGRRKRT